MWTCPKCEQENSDNLSKCILCETGKPQQQTSENNTLQQAFRPIQPDLVELQPKQQANQSDAALDKKQATNEKALLEWNVTQDPKKQLVYESKTEESNGESFGFWFMIGLGACAFLIVLTLFIRGIISYVSP